MARNSQARRIATSTGPFRRNTATSQPLPVAAQLNGHQDAAPVRELINKTAGRSHVAAVMIASWPIGTPAASPAAPSPVTISTHPDTGAFQVHPALRRQAGDQLDPNHFPRRTNQLSHDRREPARPRADLQHRLPLQAEQMEQPQHVAQYVDNSSSTIDMPHDLVTVDDWKKLIRRGVVACHGHEIPVRKRCTKPCRGVAATASRSRGGRPSGTPSRRKASSSMAMNRAMWVWKQYVLLTPDGWSCYMNPSTIPSGTCVGTNARSTVKKNLPVEHHRGERWQAEKK